ncbi:MAG: B12-binding domain-containing radical SAM protein [Desulfobacterota bacterium]|nr:B12-binding domain-containing radical SAM protein [Thermodesulfobacteriota bacterium]
MGVLSVSHAKVALVYPEVKTRLSGCNPPYALMSLGTMLQTYGIDVRIFDADAYGGKLDALVKDLAAYGPAITGMPVYASSFNTIDSLIRFMQAYAIGTEILLGGPEVTADSETVFEAFPSVQYGLMGEADESFAAFVLCYIQGKDFQHIPGLVYRNGPRLTKNPPQEIQDLDRLPIPNRALLRTEYARGLYWRLGCRGKTDIVVTSRGCPFACRFCFKISKKPRYRSAWHVHREIEHILSLGIKNIHFMDDLLIVNFNRIQEIFDPFDRKLGIRFKVRSRASFITDEIVAYLAEKGVREIVCGYESGSDTILTLMNKNVTVDENIRAIRTIKKYGIKAFADMIIMYPGETWETARETVAFIYEAKPSYINWSFFMPFNGTPITEELRSRGLVEGKCSINQQPVVRYDYLSSDEYEKLSRYLIDAMSKYNRQFRNVMLPNLKDVLLSSGLRQYRVLGGHYLKSLWTRLSGRAMQVQ